MVKARTRLRVAADAWYPRTIRCGSGVRASSVNSKSLTMSPRYAGKLTPPRVSVGAERGLVYCPAIRPILTTGSEAP